MEEMALTVFKEYGPTIFTLFACLVGMLKLLDKCERREEMSREKWEAAQNRTVNIMSDVVQKNTEAYIEVKSALREVRK